jgi:hypothetical protein
LHNTAYARGIGASAQANGGRNNTAIAIGDQVTSEEPNRFRPRTTTAIAGRPNASAAERALQANEFNNNTAVAIGDGSQATAGGGNNNVARVLGNRSRATAGDGNNNVATVRGNDSAAEAGQGSFSRARVVGDRSSAAAIGDRKRVTVRGDNVHSPSESPES